MTHSLLHVNTNLILKDILVELLEERREEFSALLPEALEDMALSRAIREGEDTGLVDKSKILRIFAGQP